MLKEKVDAKQLSTKLFSLKLTMMNAKTETTDVSHGNNYSMYKTKSKTLRHNIQRDP